MAFNAFKSASKTIAVIYKDSEGSVVDPRLETIHNIEVIIVNRFDGSVLAKYSRETQTGWSSMELSATEMTLRISPAMLNDANKGLYEIQVNTIIPDDDMPGGYAINTNKGILLSVTEAYI